MNNRIHAALAASLVFAPLAACSYQPPVGDGEIEESTGQTLAAVIGGTPDLSTVATALNDAGLASVFEGPGSYTVLAPNDAAFKALGEDGQALMQPDQRPILIAILRDHIVPGQLTPDSIRDAIAAKGGPVEMRTLGDGTVRFSLDGDTIKIADEDGAQAALSGTAIAASNGSVIALDGFAKATTPPQ